jgi:hypothetical protein
MPLIFGGSTIVIAGGRQSPQHGNRCALAVDQPLIAMSRSDHTSAILAVSIG